MPSEPNKRKFERISGADEESSTGSCTSKNTTTNIRGHSHTSVVSPAHVGHPPISPPSPVNTPANTKALDSTNVVDHLGRLHNVLKTWDADRKVETNYCDRRAVCWNFAFTGGKSAKTVDPTWAYLYVTQSLYGYKERSKQIEEKAKAAGHGVKSLLDKAREKYANRTNKKVEWLEAGLEPDVQELIVRALLKERGIKEEENGKLKLIAHYEKRKTPMYHHFEFEYGDFDLDSITITKGSDEDLRAFHGESDLGDGDFSSIKIGINPESLSKDHKICIKNLCANAQKGQMGFLLGLIKPHLP
jgi:hypothetical protein